MQQPPNPYPQQQWQQPPQQQWNLQQPPYPPQQYQQPPQPPKEPKRKWYQRLFAWCRRHPIATAVIIVVFLIMSAVYSLTYSSQPSTTTPTTQPTQATQQVQVVPTAKPKPQATQQAQPTQIPTPQSTQYPPRTIADLRGLAAKGDASAINEFHSESVGLTGVCPQPKRAVTVNSSVTGKQLAEDLLAYFYANQLDSPCGSLVLAYHNQGEANDTYTAGRIIFDVTDSSGAANVDPNANNLKYTLTLDIGDVATGQEYVVTY